MKEMNKYIILFALGLAPLFGGLQAQKQKEKQKVAEGVERKALSETELIDLALKNNGQVKARSLELKASHSLRATAFDLPKADISAQYGHYDGPDNNLAFEISQTLPFPTLFWAKAKELKAGRELAEIKLASQKNKIRQAVRILVEEIRHNTARLAYQDRLRDAYLSCHSIVEKHRELGESSQQELAMVSIKLKKADNDWLNTELELSRLYQKLNAICGNFSRGQRLILSLKKAEKELITRTLDKSIAQNFLEDNLDLKALNSEISELKAKKNVSLSEQLPDITLGYQNGSAVGIHTINGKDVAYGIKDRLSSFSVGLSIPLNLFSAHAKVKAMRLETEAKSEELKQVQREILSDFYELNNLYLIEKERVLYYKEQLMPEAETMLKLAKESYKLGESSYLAYAQVLETYNDVKEEYINSSLKLNLYIINLYALCNK